jgi:hypothetical protein
MNWENVIKAEYVWLLYENPDGGWNDELIGIFKSEEAANEWIKKTHMLYGKFPTTEQLEDIMASYGYHIDKKELKG